MIKWNNKVLSWSTQYPEILLGDNILYVSAMHASVSAFQSFVYLRLI